MDDNGDHLLKDCDHIFNVNDWETTFGSDSIYELAEAADITWENSAKIATVGRLRALSSVYAVNVPVEYDDDGDVSEWEVKVFETREAAEAAFKAAFPQTTEAAS